MVQVIATFLQYFLTIKANKIGKNDLSVIKYGQTKSQAFFSLNNSIVWDITQCSR
jgi:hypothetical protein